MKKQEILNTIFNKLVEERNWSSSGIDLELMNHIAEIVVEMQGQELPIHNVVCMFPKCEHKNIDRQDGCDECLDCGVRNY